MRSLLDVLLQRRTRSAGVDLCRTDATDGMFVLSVTCDDFPLEMPSHSDSESREVTEPVNQDGGERRLRRLDGRGMTLVELVVSLALALIVLGSAIPMLLSYLWSSTTDSGARELRTALNRARQIAVTNRSNVCVRVGGSRYQFLPNARCDDSDPWRGPGSDERGNFRVANNVRLEGPLDGPVFTPTGSTLAEKEIRVFGPRGDSLRVKVDRNGRIYTP